MAKLYADHHPAGFSHRLSSTDQPNGLGSTHVFTWNAGGLRELSGETQALASRTYRIFEYFAVTAVIYYVIVKIILLGSRMLATRLFRY